jgi:transglutaminase-like putative cysteine protease
VKRIFLLLLTLITLASCSNKLPDLSTIEQQFNTGFEQTPISLTSYGKQLGGQLYSPRYDDSSVESTFTVDGFVKQYHKLTQKHMWIQVTFQGEPKNSLPKRFEYYTAIKEGKFSESIKLFAGIGDYQVKIYVPGTQKNRSYYLFSQFTVINQSPDIQADVTYSLLAEQQKMQLTSPIEGYVTGKGTIAIEGSLSKEFVKKKILIQVQKGNKKWQRIITTTNKATFHETIPLLYGEGVHQLEILLPDDTRTNYFRNGAKFYVENKTKDNRSPVQYSVIYEQRGIHLTAPIAGGGQGEYSYRVKGYLDSTAEQAKETTHLIVQTKKDGLLATYFVPIKKFAFNSFIPLRFGPGNYDVIVYVPEITRHQRDYFRFFMVAKFQVSSYADEDKRDLLPSRGIEPDHPKIIKLAKKITKNANTNYERTKLIYRYVAKNMNYDMQKFEQNSFKWNDSAIKSLQLKKGVCQDYVFLTLSLLRSLEIPSRFVEGVANGQNHAWVEAKVNGEWLIMDPTWGSGYIDPNRGFVKHYDGRFFDISSKRLEKTHKRTGIVY